MSAHDAVASLWERFRPLVAARVELLERFADGDPDVTVEDAAATAHKLAGALGSYGRQAGTRAARDVEQLLDEQDATDARARLLEAVSRLRDAVQT